MAAIPDVLRLHHARLSERDVQTIDGVRVTTPLRTLVDVIAEGALAPELQVQAVEQALRRGLIMRRQLEIARVSTLARQRIHLEPKRLGFNHRNAGGPCSPEKWLAPNDDFDVVAERCHKGHQPADRE